MTKEINQNIIKIDTKKMSNMILLYFITIEITFVFLDFIINFNRFIDYGPIRRLFNIAREDSLSSWFMSAQTLIVALVLWAIFFIHHKLYTEDIYKKIGWAILAMFFTYMAADDAAIIHERLGSTFKLVAESSKSDEINAVLNYFPSYAWQIVILPFFIFMGIFMLIFLWKIFKKGTMMYKILLAFSVLSTAVILDFFEGLDEDSPYNIYQIIMNSYDVRLHTLEHFSKAIEEALEMIGITIFLSVFIEYIGKINNKIRIEI